MGEEKVLSVHDRTKWELHAFSCDVKLTSDKSSASLSPGKRLCPITLSKIFASIILEAAEIMLHFLF